MIDGSAYLQFSNTPTHLQPDTFPILFLPDAELPSLEEIRWITNWASPKPKVAAQEKQS